MCTSGVEQRAGCEEEQADHRRRPTTKGTLDLVRQNVRTGIVLDSIDRDSGSRILIPDLYLAKRCNGRLLSLACHHHRPGAWGRSGFVEQGVRCVNDYRGSD